MLNVLISELYPVVTELSPLSEKTATGIFFGADDKAGELIANKLSYRVDNQNLIVLLQPLRKK